MKKYLLKSFALLAMLFSALTMSAVTKYCGEAVQSTVDNTTVSIGVTILKVGDALRVSFDSEYISGISNGGTFQQWGNGVWANEADAVANFKEGWTQSGTTWTKDFTFSTYPTSGVGKIYCLFNIVNAGNPPVAGFTLTDIDLFNASCDSSGEGGSEDNESPVMTSATVESYTHNSAVIAVEAEDNIGVVKYHIVDANNGIDEMLTATAGKITLANLSSATTYNLTISAIDKVGNESTGRTVTAFTTDALLYCDFPTGHESNAAFGDVNGRILVSAIKVTPKKIRLLIKSAAEATKNIDLVYVAPVGAAAVTVGSDVVEGGSREVAVDIEYATAPATYGFMIQWSNPNWTGRWQASINNILPSQLCTEPVEVYDVNFALTANGSSAEATSGDAAQAIDNNAGSRWESASADPQTWTLDLGQARIFNTLEIVWEGAYGKTFTVSVSDDKETWTPVWTVEGQELAGFPYTQTQKIDKTTARYIQFHGTERGTGYGYSFWEFRVYLAGTSTLTSLEATPANGLAKVGEGLAINVTAKDQNGKTMANAGEVTYTITPVDAGTITDNVYTPARIGLASIVATIGEVSAPAFEVFAYDGENLALNKSATAGHLNEQAYLSNDNDMGTRWGSYGASHPDNDWWYVDLGNAYDIYAVAIMWENARPANYVLEASETAADDSWLPIKTITGVLPTTSPNYEVYVDLTPHSCRYMRVRTTSTEGGYENLAYGISMFDVQVFGTESASPTKAVSASVNDAAMGTATVTKDGVAVTEVTTGSEVTFTATANEGYIFVNWSNGNTNPSFTTTVNAAMNLTANFRALGNIYCNTEMTVDGHTIYVTMKCSAPETYQLIVRSEENLTNFGGTNFYRSNNIHVIDLRDQGVLSEDKHILTATFSAETAPYMGTPLYVVFEGIGERTYPQLTNIEYDVECSEDVTVTGLALDPASVSIMVGGSQTLKPVFTPAHAFTNELQWTSSSESIATVDANGLVTAVAEGEAVIAATLLSNPAITATCNVTVTAFTAHTFYGNGADGGVDFAYNLTYNANGTVTIVADILTNNPGLGVTSFSIDEEWKDMTKNANGTYTRTSEKTFSVGQEVHCFLYAPYTNGVGRLDFDYIIGSSNERPNVAVTSVVLDQTYCNLLINETTQLTATINPGFADNKNVTWSSSAENVATVDANGLVTAKSAGTATITVTTVDGGKTATCTINVVAALTDATYHANDFFTINGQLVGFNYTITRTSERKLRYELTVNGEAVVEGTPVAFNIQLNDGGWNNMTDEGSGHFTFESSSTYNDNDPFVGFFYAVYDGGASHVNIYNYTVGSTNSPVPTMVAINESDEAANVALTGSIDAVIGRAFTNAYWQTISLPFALNQGQLKEVFGDGVQVAKLNSSIVASTDNATFELNFVYVSEIEAATPYLIHPSKEVAKGQVVRDVPVNLNPKNVLTADATMIPVLFKSTFPAAETNYWLAENGYLYGGATDIEGMRAYFTFPKLTAEQASKMRARVVFNENTETSVDNITIDESAVKVIQNGQLIIIRNGEKYNVQGQKL